MNLSSIALFVLLFILAAVGAFVTGRLTAPTPPPIYLPSDPSPPTIVTYKTHETKTRTVTRHVVVDGGTTTTDETEHETTTTDAAAPTVVAAPSNSPAPLRPVDVGPRRDLRAGISFDLTFTPRSAIHYGVLVDYRVYGPVWIGARVTTLPSVGVSASVEF